MMLILFIFHQHVANCYENCCKNNEWDFEMRRNRFLILFPFSMQFNWALFVVAVSMVIFFTWVPMLMMVWLILMFALATQMWISCHLNRRLFISI